MAKVNKVLTKKQISDLRADAKLVLVCCNEGSAAERVAKGLLAVLKGL